MLIRVHTELQSRKLTSITRHTSTILEFAWTDLGKYEKTLGGLRFEMLNHDLKQKG